VSSPPSRGSRDESSKAAPREREDDRWDYGERRVIAIGMVERMTQERKTYEVAIQKG